MLSGKKENHNINKFNDKFNTFTSEKICMYFKLHTVFFNPEQQFVRYIFVV